jgi:hypothetical protein
MLGVLVSISSVGAGAIGVIYLPMAKIVGSDIAHAVPPNLIVGTGHWMMGSVDWQITGSLLAGSLQGMSAVILLYASPSAPSGWYWRPRCLWSRAASPTTMRQRLHQSLPLFHGARCLEWGSKD